MLTAKRKKLNIKPQRIFILAALLCLLLIILAFGITAAARLRSSSIYKGIYVGEVDVSGMTQDEAETAVREHYAPFLTGTIRLRCSEQEVSVDLSALSAEIDADSTTSAAYAAARTGNPFHRLKEIRSYKKHPLVLPPVIRCNDEVLTSKIGELASLADRPGEEMKLEPGETELIVTRGVAGFCLNQSAAAELFKSKALTLSDGVLQLELEEVRPAEPNAAAIYEEICGDPIDASYKVENQKLVIIDEKPGIRFDQKEAQKIIDETTGTVIKIPITVTPASLTASQLKASLFNDLLGSYSSKYNAGDTARSYNVSLACKKINEVVLAPGDIFSYNDTVGPRTTERGFRTANVYVGNKVEPGVGGGICQVSSTLFNAVVLADLHITQRTNHSLPVSYVPLGRDATVSYGSIDFRFANNTSAPIKIVASASGGTNAIYIYCKKDDKSKMIEIQTENTGTTQAKLVQKEDPTLPAGTVKVEQKGSNGSSYNTYKITKQNGSVVKKELLTKSTYVPSDRIEIIGTAPPEEPEAESAVAELPSDETTAEPVAD